MTRARSLVAGAVVTALFGLLTALGWAIDPAQAAHSWLAAWMFVLSVAVGSLFLVMIGHAANATWFVAVRRPAEVAMATLPVLALGVIPLLLSLSWLYPWAGDVSALPRHAEQLIEKKRAWLSQGFFAVRSLGYVAVLGCVAELLFAWSRRQDREQGERLRRRLVAGSSAGLVLVALVLSFGAFDWLMSLDPLWASNVFGVYVFAGGLASALALLGLAVARGRARGVLPAQVGPDHLHALGRLLLAFVIFWAYIAFCQFLLIWIADLPEEVRFYLDRWGGGWGGVGLALVGAHFVVPFFALLSRDLKRRRGALTLLCAWVLLAHYVDVYWLVLPALHPQRLAPHWLDASALLAACGVFVLAAAWRARGLPEHPLGDPLLAESLSYESA